MSRARRGRSTSTPAVRAIGIRRAAGVAAALVGGACLALPALAGAVSASAPPAWTKLGADENTVTVVPSIALDGANVVAAWSVPTPGAGRVQAATLTPTVAPSGRAPRVVNVVSGWSSIDSPVLLGKPGGGLQVLLSAFHSTVTGDPLNGVSFIPRNTDGTWGTPAAANAGYSASTAILASDGATPLFATTSSGVFRVYRGAANPSVVDLAAALGPTGDYEVPRLGRDGTGRYWVAWFGDGGLRLIQIDPATGAPIGSAALAPQSGGISDNSLAIPLACGPQNCRLVYHQTLANGTDTGRILTWAPGEAAPTAAVTGADPASNMAAAYRADGRLWIVWYDRSGTPTYRAKLGNARGAGGGIRSLGLPSHGQSYSAGVISAIDAGGNLAVVSNFQNNGIYNQWFTVAGPPVGAGGAGGVDTSGIDNPSVIRRGSSTFVIPRHPSLGALRKTKCVKVKVGTTVPAAIRVAIFSGRKSIRIFGATVVHFTKPGSRIVCIRVPLRAHTFDVRKPFRFAFAVRLGAHPARATKATLTTSRFLNFG